ncbi:hypothetical protein J23TS9_53350 [Paenibacillus sp. J23TS9]|nr:hypothetical protein J23TS9_53350 [Paenibacillus sp. J23TS9]
MLEFPIREMRLHEAAKLWFTKKDKAENCLQQNSRLFFIFRLILRYKYMVKYDFKRKYILCVFLTAIIRNDGGNHEENGTRFILYDPIFFNN